MGGSSTGLTGLLEASASREAGSGFYEPHGTGLRPFSGGPKRRTLRPYSAKTDSSSLSLPSMPELPELLERVDHTGGFKDGPVVTGSHGTSMAGSQRPMTARIRPSAPATSRGTVAKRPMSARTVSFASDDGPKKTNYAMPSAPPRDMCDMAPVAESVTMEETVAESLGKSVEETLADEEEDILKLETEAEMAEMMDKSGGPKLLDPTDTLAEAIIGNSVRSDRLGIILSTADRLEVAKAKAHMSGQSIDEGLEEKSQQGDGEHPEDRKSSHRDEESKVITYGLKGSLVRKKRPASAHPGTPRAGGGYWVPSA